MLTKQRPLRITINLSPTTSSTRSTSLLKTIYLALTILLIGNLLAAKADSNQIYSSYKSIQDQDDYHMDAESMNRIANEQDCKVGMWCLAVVTVLEMILKIVKNYKWSTFKNILYPGFIV